MFIRFELGWKVKIGAEKVISMRSESHSRHVCGSMAALSICSIEARTMTLPREAVKSHGTINSMNARDICLTCFGSSSRNSNYKLCVFEAFIAQTHPYLLFKRP